MIKKIPYILLMLSGLAYAEGGFYTGIGLGYAGLDNTAQSNQIIGSGNSSSSVTSNAFATNIYFGYDFNHYIGVQEEYDVAYNSNVGNSYSANQQVFGTDILFHLPFSLFSNDLAGLDVFAKGGLGYEVFQFSGSNGCPNCVDPAHQGGSFVPMYGAGVEYGFTNVGYRLEWDGIGSITNNNQGMSQVAMSSNMYLLSIMYHF